MKNKEESKEIKELKEIMQLYQEGMASSSIIFEAFDLDYDEEIKRIREEENKKSKEIKIKKKNRFDIMDFK